MKRSFTRINLVLLGVLGLFVTGLNGQAINRLTISSPASIAADYPVVLAEFGDQSGITTCGDVVLADDGDTTDADPTNPDPGSVSDACQNGISNASGAIVLIDRGDCQFGFKALNAENSGAVAVVICNDEDTDPFVMVPGDDGDNVNIPTFMMSRANCDIIKAELGGPVSACLQYVCGVPTYGPEVYWGKNPGEGDFANGLGDWTTDNPVAWIHNTDGNISGGSFGGTQADGPTACNGVALFYGDLLDSNGTGAMGTGPCANNCIAALISPTIDLSAGSGEGWSIQWSQAVRDFTSTYNLILSKNGGTTWPDTVNLNSHLYTNDFAQADDRVRIALPGYEGAQSLTFKFEISGETSGFTYYFWSIDDVVVIDGAYEDVRINQNFWATAPKYATPASQVSEMPFLADVASVGNQTATGVSLNMTIYDEMGTSLWSADNPYVDMPGNTIIENQAFPDTYTPPATPGLYFGVYTLSSDNDIENSVYDNSFEFPFTITENRFSQIPTEAEVGAYMEFALDNLTFWSDEPYYSVGNTFYIPNGAGQELKTVIFGLNNDPSALPAGTIEVGVYEYLDLDYDITDPQRQRVISPSERQLVASTSIIADTAADKRNIIAVPTIPGTNGDLLQLKDDTQYAVMVHTNPVLATDPQMEILGVDPRSLNLFLKQQDHTATDYAFDGTGNFVNRSSTSLISDPGADGGDAEDRDFFGRGFKTVYLDITIGLSTSTNDLNNDLDVSFFPNPVQDLMYLNISLEDASNVSVEITNVEGKVVATQSFKNVISEKLKMDVAHLSSGAYFVKVTTEEGFTTKRVVIQK